MALTRIALERHHIAVPCIARVVGGRYTDCSSRSKRGCRVTAMVDDKYIVKMFEHELIGRTRVSPHHRVTSTN